MSWLRAFVLLAVAAPAFAIACSDPPEKPPAGIGTSGPIGGGGGTSAEGGADSATAVDGGDGGVCNDLVNLGQTIDRIGVVGEPPVTQGGVVADGTYSLTDYSVYVGAGGLGGPTGLTAKASIRIAAGRFDELYEFGGSGNPSVRSTSSTYSATGATLAANELCPTITAGKQLQYTSNDPVLVLVNVSTKEAFTFTKR
jgi:hypothetical protein